MNELTHDQDPDEDNPFKGAVIGTAIGMVVWFGALGIAYFWLA